MRVCVCMHAWVSECMSVCVCACIHAHLHARMCCFLQIDICDELHFYFDCDFGQSATASIPLSLLCCSLMTPSSKIWHTTYFHYYYSSYTYTILCTPKCQPTKNWKWELKLQAHKRKGNSIWKDKKKEQQTAWLTKRHLLWLPEHCLSKHLSIDVHTYHAVSIRHKAFLFFFLFSLFLQTQTSLSPAK